MGSNFNVKRYWEDNKHLILNCNELRTFAKEKIGLIKKEPLDLGNKKTITYSEISTYATCSRKWDLEYNCLWSRKITKNYFYIGGILHDCMEYLYTVIYYIENGTLQHIQVKETHIIEFFEFLSNFTIQKLKVDYPEREMDIAELEFENNKGYAIITEYMNTVLPTDSFKIIKRPENNKPFLETVFFNQVITDNGTKSNKFVHTGKIDGLVMLDGLYYLFEHKFLQNFDSSDEEWLGKDLQILSYVSAIQKVCNIKISGVIYNVVKKPKLRQKAGTKKTPPETTEQFRQRIIEDFAQRPEFYFKRYTVWVNQENVKDIPAFIYANCKEMGISRCLPAASFICKRTGCIFKEVCLSDNPLEVLEQNFRIKEEKHEEL